jgi:hypothetical protein
MFSMMFAKEIVGNRAESIGWEKEHGGLCFSENRSWHIVNTQIFSKYICYILLCFELCPLPKFMCYSLNQDLRI